MPFLTYLKIAALITAMAVGATGAWWVQGQRLDKANATIALKDRQLNGYKKAVAILKADAKIDQEEKEDAEKIDSMSPDDLIANFDELRRRAKNGSGKGANSRDADN